MDKREYYIELYEEYKLLLTSKQQEYFNKYYYEDLSLNEIAELNNVSKSLISKTINQVINKLNEYESKLNLNMKSKKLKNIVNEIENSKLKDKLEDILYQ